MLPELITLLRGAGLDPTAREIADVLWLAAQIARPAEPRPAQDQPELPQAPVTKPVEPPPAAAQPPAPAPAAGSAPAPALARPRSTPPMVSVHQSVKRPATASTGGAGVAFRAPSAAALPGARELGKALRPLRRRVASRTRFVLDEAATADRLADARLARLSAPDVVLRPAPARWLDVALVVDEASSMAIWQATVVELQAMLARHGAFRDVRAYRLATDEARGLALYSGSAGNTRRVCGARELFDPRGMRLVIVVSDCVARAWDDGQMAELLAGWGRHGPIALLHLLPERLWLRTGLGAAVPVRLRSPGRGGPSESLEAERISQGLRPAPLVGTKLPVAALDPESLRSLARLIAGAGGARARGVLLQVGPPASALDAVRRLKKEPTPRERVEQFRRLASPTARRLAALLAAAAPLSLPVIRLVRETMAPEATQGHLAEVFLGGLLYEQIEGAAPAAPDEVRYEFHEDTRELLIGSARVSEATEVLRRVSEYVSGRIGQPRDFQALLAGLDGGGGAPIPESDRPFAKIHAMMLRLLGGEHARLAERIERRLRPASGAGPGELSDEVAAQMRDAVTQIAAAGRAISISSREQAFIDLRIDLVEDRVRFATESSRGVPTHPHTPGPPLGRARLEAFARSVGSAIQTGEPLRAAAIVEAQGLHEALVRDELGAATAQVATGAPTLVRLLLGDPELQGIPWEALSRPGADASFLGADPRLVVARGVISSDPWEPREVRGAVRVLAIAPTGAEARLGDLRSALAGSIEAGEIEWLDPDTGPTAGSRHGPKPHVLHVFGQGAETGSKSEQLVQELMAGGYDLRLVVLEASAGTRAGALGAVAERLVRAGVDAVVAQLWPLRSVTSRFFTEAFYRSLTAGGLPVGDVGASIAAVRTTLLHAGAEAFSPVLYLRGRGTGIFDFRSRRLRSAERPETPPRTGGLHPALRRLLARPFSLIFGEYGLDQREQADFRAALEERLLEHTKLAVRGLLLSTLAQWFEMYFGRDLLMRLFVETMAPASPRPAFVDALARHLHQGVHLSLSWLPWLERALARHQPDRTVRVVMGAPRDGRPLHLLRRAGSTEWKQARAEGVDPGAELVVLRPYGGIRPDGELLEAVRITEDDHDLNPFYSGEPWWDGCCAQLVTRPALIAGASLLDSRHRRLLRWAYRDRPLPVASLASTANTVEHEIWTRERCDVISGEADDLARQIASIEAVLP